MGCFYEHTHTHNKGLGREYMGHANSVPVLFFSYLRWSGPQQYKRSTDVGLTTDEVKEDVNRCMIHRELLVSGHDLATLGDIFIVGMEWGGKSCQ